LRPHMPEKSGMEVVSAAITGQTNATAEMKPATARWKYFLAMSRIARSHVRCYQRFGKIPPPA
jgi:hypothetical protein